jgi:hypothetical protein
MSIMKAIKDLSLRTLDELFRSATSAAREEADKHDLPRVGIDKDGKLVTPKKEKMPYRFTA